MEKKRRKIINGFSNVTPETFETVLQNVLKQFQEEPDEEVRQFWADELDNMLDRMSGEDFFGTEDQNDPRGDPRG